MAVKQIKLVALAPKLEETRGKSWTDVTASPLTNRIATIVPDYNWINRKD